MVWIVRRVSKDYRIFLDDCVFSEVEVVNSPTSYVCWFFYELSESQLIKEFGHLIISRISVADVEVSAYDYGSPWNYQIF